MESKALRFSPSVIYAGIDIRKKCVTEGLTSSEASDSLSHGAPSDVTANDIVGAMNWIEMYGVQVFDFNAKEDENFRQTLRNMILALNPSWLRLAPMGRQGLLEGLPSDITQSFRIAGLVGETATPAVDWWDEISRHARQLTDLRKSELGRAAERRSFEREVEITSHMGLQPIWTSIDDNNAGYDIKTWRLNDAGLLVAHYIEVKSSVSARRIYLSRGEAKFAERYAKSWNIDFWLGDNSTALEFSYFQILAGLPQDTETSKWTEAEINVEDLVQHPSSIL
jgi:hypothetical protein